MNHDDIKQWSEQYDANYDPTLKNHEFTIEMHSWDLRSPIQ